MSNISNLLSHFSLLRLSRKTPFEAETEDELYELIKAGDIKFDGPEWENITEAGTYVVL